MEGHPLVIDIEESLCPREGVDYVAGDLVRLARRFERDGKVEGRIGLPEKLKIVPFGVGPEFRPLEGGPAREEARRALGLERPYVLFVGRVERKKNLRRVVEAFFAAVVSKNLPHELVLAGPGGRARDLKKLLKGLGLAGRVRRMGYVPDERLPLLYAAAELLLFPSVVEGFGFPVLEAMACGTPCVVSRAPALAELAGGAALAAPADDLARLREAVERVLLDPERAAALRGKGLVRAKRFTWERTADLTVAAYEEARSRFESR